MNEDQGTVLVTGGAGFIGFHLTRELLKQERRVVALDNFQDFLPGSEIKYCRWQSLESENLTKINLDLATDDLTPLNEYGVSTVYNMAALPGFLKDWSDIRPYFESNLLALNRLLYHFRNSDISNFIQASTSSVYGSRALGDESQGLKPISPYGVSKLAAEKLAMTYFDNYKTPIKILRYFSVYGPSQRPDMAFAKIIRCIKSNTPFEMYGDGTQMRSNTFIRDVIDATIKAEFMEVGEVINICGDEHASLNEIIQIIESLSNTKLRISKLTGRKGDQENTFGDNSKAKRILGWIPKTSLRQGLKEQFENMANL